VIQWVQVLWPHPRLHQLHHHHRISTPVLVLTVLLELLVLKQRSLLGKHQDNLLRELITLSFKSRKVLAVPDLI
jgi:hypothetical protein